MLRGYRTNPDIDEYLGLGLGDSGDPDYVTAGSRVHYEAEARLPLLDVFSGKTLALMLQQELSASGAFSGVMTTFPDVYINRGTLVVELTSQMDRNSISDIQGNIRESAGGQGFAIDSDRIDFISRAAPGVIPPPVFVPTSFRPPAGPSSGGILDQIKRDLGVSGTTLGVAAAVIIGVVVLSVVKK